VGTWGDGFANGQTSSVTIDIPTNCAPVAPPPKYFVDYYCNNGVGPVDQVLRIVNVGVNGTPLTSPVGDICANVYVFDNTQEMVSCCSCRITPDEYASASVRTQLTNNTLTGMVPQFGVVKAVTTSATGSCDPTAPLTGADTSLARVFGTHKQVIGGATFVTETEKRWSPLSTEEGGFLPTACLFVRYLGSGKGVCSCTILEQNGLPKPTPGIGPPTNKDQCKNGGWQAFTIPRQFNNQGDCVSFVNTGK
jgi:hypothetical protein